MSDTTTSQHPETLEAAMHLQGVFGGLATLIRLELQLALKRTPQLLLLALLVLPLVVICWLGLSILISYLLSLWSGSTLIGLLGFVIVNCTALATGVFYLKRWGKQLSMPESRAAVRDLIENLQGASAREQTRTENNAAA